ncbi:DUF7501 family protein [Haloarcula halophila]|uniref:DUF7501 family protein n=1 Tax=Haloarcula TaxID=2237 RepID=UPI0023E442DF|nr:hypothetical protein [Halomicroarcula sp. DFY41]
MATTETWTDPDRCPFCGARLSSPGAGFVDHVQTTPECEDAFGTWRDRVDDDLVRGWTG